MEWRWEQVVILSRVARIGFIEKVTFEKDLKLGGTPTISCHFKGKFARTPLGWHLSGPGRLVAPV